MLLLLDKPHNVVHKKYFCVVDSKNANDIFKDIYVLSFIVSLRLTLFNYLSVVLLYKLLRYWQMRQMLDRKTSHIINIYIFY